MKQFNSVVNSKLNKLCCFSSDMQLFYGAHLFSKVWRLAFSVYLSFELQDFIHSFIQT